MTSKYILRDCRKMSELHPNYYRMVPRDVLDAIVPGDTVRLIFEDALGHLPPESIWVKIILKADDIMKGETLHKAFSLPIKLGEIVTFEPRHVAAMKE